MTATVRARVDARRVSGRVEALRQRVPTRRRRPATPRSDEQRVVPPLNPRRHLIRGCAIVVLVLTAALLLHLLFVSSLQQRASQQRVFDQFRSELAVGTAAIGPTGPDGELLATGAPVALLEIPSIGLSQVVVEGSSAGELFIGPGHRRDTALPGQLGVSVIVGRRASYGGPFADLGELDPGAVIEVTTGQGKFDYRVLGVRKEGDPLPAAPVADGARLVLATADGTPFVPSGVLRVDADLQGAAVGGPARVMSAASLPDEEELMATDSRTLWALALWLQALLGVGLFAVWAWHRWGRAQAWVVFFPPLMLVGLLTSGELARLLPNLL